MDDKAMASLLLDRAASTAVLVHSAAITLPFSLDSMDQAAVQALPNAHKVLARLRTIYGLCQQVQDRPRACLHAHARLHQAFVRIAGVTKHDSLPKTFHLSHFFALLHQLKAVLDQHLKLSNLVAKMVASRRLLSGLARVHRELNVLLVDNVLVGATSPLLMWKQQFAADRVQDEKSLHDTLMGLLSTPTFVNQEFSDERRQALVLLELVAEFATTEPPRGHSSQLLETLKMTHRRISNLCDLHLRRVPRWYLPRCDVDFSLLDHIIGHSRGSFGSTLHRGEAYRYHYKKDGILASSATSTVAVKCFWALPDVQHHIVEHLFTRSGVAKWTRVRHPNVVTMRGASHAANPPYLVRDFTTYGGLTSYLAALETRARECAGAKDTGKMETLTWQLLYGASRGLVHLHEEHKIVHGGLRCNNILVDKRGRAVIADFGLYTLACDARDSGLTKFFQHDVFDAECEELIRWQAPECLREHVAYRESLPSLSKFDAEIDGSAASASATSFATDVYAFGMCILEALTRLAPWSGLDIAKIRTLKGNLCLLPPRPTHISAQAWTLIESMCAADPKQRITMSEASQELKRLGYGNRVLNQLQDNSSNDLEVCAAVKVDRLSDVIEKVSHELHHLRGESRSRGSSNGELEIDAAVNLVQVTTSFDEISQELNDILGHFCSGSGDDMEELKERTSQQLVRVSSLLHIACQKLEQLGTGDQRRCDSRQSSTSKVITLAQEALAKLSLMSSDGSSGLSEQASTESQSATAGSPTAKLLVGTPCVRAETVKELTTGEMSACSDAPTIEQTSRRVKTAVSTLSDHCLDLSDQWKIGAVGDEKFSNIWGVSPEKTKECHSYDIERSLPSTLIESDERSESDDESKRKERTNDSGEVSSAEVNSNRSMDGQPEQEMDNDFGSLKTDDDSEDSIALLGSDGANVDSETPCETTLHEEALLIVPAEFQTALSYDEATDPASPHYPVIVLLERLRSKEPDEASFVEALVAIKDDLELTTATIVVEREGLLTLMELVWRNYSEDCTMRALELLKVIAGLSLEFVTILVQSKVVKILLAVVKHRTSPQQVNFAASFILELINENDEAKRQLWTCRGASVMETSAVIDRRLVQEVKGLMAKFKRSEGYKCLENSEFHLAIDKFTEAIALDRKRAGYYADRSLAYMEVLMFKKAADDAYRCIRYNPYDVTGYLRHGLALKAMGKFKEAIVSLQKGAEVDPNFSKICDVLVETEKLLNAGPKGEGNTTVLRHMTATESAKLKKKDGDDALRKKDFALAIQIYTEALELNPKNDCIYLHRSIAYAACGEHAKAIEDASKCIRINYRQVEGYYRLALALHAAGQHDQALGALYRGHEVDSRHIGITRFISQLESEEAKAAELPLAEWFKVKGYRAFQLRSYEEAIKFYTKAIDASQSDDDEIVMHCYLYRSRAYQTRGEFTAVIADCTYVLDRRPRNVFARLRRADAYEHQRDFHMALQDIRELVALNPDYKDAHARLCSLEHRCRLLPGYSEHNVAVTTRTS